MKATLEYLSSSEFEWRIQQETEPSWALLSVNVKAYPLAALSNPVYAEFKGEHPVPFRIMLALGTQIRPRHQFLIKLPSLAQSAQVQLKGLPKTVEIEKVELRYLNRVSAGIRVILPKLRKFLFEPQRFVGLFSELYPVWRQGGLRALKQSLGSIINANQVKSNYTSWVQTYDQLNDADRQAILKRLSLLQYQPLISVVMPVYNVDEIWLRKAIESVRKQLYQNWEFCIADDLSPASHIRKVLEEYQALDSRIRVVFRKKNGHISEASNSALEIARGEFTALLDHDDELTEHALYMMIEELNRDSKLDLIYSDEDKIDPQGNRFDPHFKSDWNPDLFYSFNLVTHLALFRTQILREIGGFRKGVEGSQDYDLVCRVFEKSDRISHIPFILYHWRAIPGSTALRPKEKNYAVEAARKVIGEHLQRKGIQASAGPGFGPLHRVTYSLPQHLPRVSIIICTRDRVDLLKTIVQGILEETDYPQNQLELLIVDNQSKETQTLEYFKSLTQKYSNVQIKSYPHPFNYSEMNNFAAKTAQGEILAFLNNDLKVISKNWLKEMVSHTLRPEIGAVGAKLYFADDTVQHAGVILGVGGTAGHAHIGIPRTSPGYLGRAVCLQSFSAVTAACMTIRKQVFDELNGFDEVHLPVAYNDIDLCLRLREKGYRNLWTPYAELYHFESASRGSDRAPENQARFEKESRYFQTKWQTQLQNDPYYNPNFSALRPDFTPAFPPRVTKPWTIDRNRN